MISIQTHSWSPMTTEFWKWVARRLVGKYSGPNAVEDSLLRGLRTLKVPVARNRIHSGAETVLVLSGKKALQEALEAKRSGLIKKVVAGPNIVADPRDADNAIQDAGIDLILVPSKWVADLWTSIAPDIAPKLRIWAAGVETKTASTRTGLPIVYDKLGDDKLLLQVKKAVGPHRQFRYGDFKHSDYSKALSDAPCLIYLSRSESQGLAIQEAWAHNVPTLVNQSDRWQNGNSYWKSPQINCPYLTPAQGAIFTDPAEIPEMMQKLSALAPKQYCDQHFSDVATAKNLLSLIS